MYIPGNRAIFIGAKYAVATAKNNSAGQIFQRTVPFCQGYHKNYFVLLRPFNQRISVLFRCSLDYLTIIVIFLLFLSNNIDTKF